MTAKRTRAIPSRNDPGWRAQLLGLCALALGALLPFSHPAAAATATLGVQNDTWVWSTLPNNNMGNDTVISVGRRIGKASEATIKRGLLHFDLSTLPSNAAITSATLRLNVIYIGGLDPLGLGGWFNARGSDHAKHSTMQRKRSTL
jgi:hypothetical protein